MLVKTVRSWVERYAPSKEKLSRSRVLRPVARYIANPNVWHFNRHSVARGVALGDVIARVTEQATRVEAAA